MDGNLLMVLVYLGCSPLAARDILLSWYMRRNLDKGCRPNNTSGPGVVVGGGRRAPPRSATSRPQRHRLTGRLCDPQGDVRRVGRAPNPPPPKPESPRLRKIFFTRILKSVTSQLYTHTHVSSASLVGNLLGFTEGILCVPSNPLVSADGRVCLALRRESFASPVARWLALMVELASCTAAHMSGTSVASPIPALPSPSHA